MKLQKIPKIGGHNFKKRYDTEVLRCVKFIVHQIRRGLDADTVREQSVNSYGFYINERAKIALARYLSK